MSDNRNTTENRPGRMLSGDEYLARKNQHYQNLENAYSKKKEKPVRFPIKSFLFIMCALVFFFSGYHLVRYFSDISRAKNRSQDLREIYTSSQTEVSPSADLTATPEATSTPGTTATPAPKPSPAAKKFSEYWPSQYANNPELVIDDSFQKLRQENRDIVGWLSIDGVLDEPVLQRDNAFYLTHDASQAKNVTGALFLDEECNLRTMTHNLIIHGHNMKEGAMFGVLKKYKLKDASFYKEHPFVEFNTLYEKGTYVIFAVTEISLDPYNHYYLPFWVYKNFDSERAFNTYINRLKEYSHFQTSVDVQPGDRLLTMATCTGINDSERLLVVARKVREGEDTIELKRGILSTTVK